MDDVYENTEEVLGCRRKFQREHQTVEDIYVNHEVIQTVQCKTTGPSPPGKKHKPIYRYYNYVLLKFCAQTNLKIKLRIVYKLSEEKRLNSGKSNLESGLL